MRVLKVLVCGLAIVVASAERAGATTITFSDFSSSGTLDLNGSAAIVTTGDGAVLRLVPALPGQGGSAFNSATINASTFSTAFQFRLTNPGGIHDGTATGADGFVFVVQNVSSSIGSAGGGLGYMGIGLSVGVEFDTWNNGGGFNDANSNHLGIDTNGNIFSLATVPVAPAFDNGDLWTAWIDYDGTTLEIRTNTTGVRPAAANLALALNIPNLLGGTTAYVGFTAGTGSAYENHDIVNWTYSDSFVEGGVEPGQVPEPAALLLMAVGAGAVARRTRRRA
jgi:hypothetical protein